MSTRWRSRVFAVLIAAVPAGCIIAEPIAELPKSTSFRPTIVRGSVVPTAAGVLISFPRQFLVPVELVDPSVDFEWRMFIDYDEKTGAGKVASGSSSYDPATDRGGIRVIAASPAQPSDLLRCHVIEFIVARAFGDDTGTTGDQRQAHSPTSTSGGGDSVTWLYSPNGDWSGCPMTDAGVSIEGTADASADSSVDGATDAASDGGI